MKITVLQSDLNTALGLLAVWLKKCHIVWMVLKNPIFYTLHQCTGVVYIEVVDPPQGTSFEITPTDIVELIKSIEE